MIAEQPSASRALRQGLGFAACAMTAKPRPRRMSYEEYLASDAGALSPEVSRLLHEGPSRKDGKVVGAPLPNDASRSELNCSPENVVDLK